MDGRVSASITITLDDGSGCYVVAVPVRSFSTRDVSEAAAIAAAALIESFVRAEAERGGEEWDPVAWRARHDSIMRSQRSEP